MRNHCGILALTASSFFIAGPGLAQQCLLAPIMSQDGESIISPYGVDRSARPGASTGYHQGLDIVNSAGRGDPILAGVHGTVFVAKDGSGGKKVGITTTDGTQRWVHFHLDSYNVRVGDVVTPDTVIGIQGSTGVSETAVHLHLSSLLRGDVVRGIGNSGGRVWRSAYGWAGTKTSEPLTSQALSGALPDDYYFVNPEPFLHHRITFNVPAAYIDQGVVRPDNLTLPTTCLPSAEYFDRSSIHSSNGGVSSSDGLQTDASHISNQEAILTTEYELKEAVISLGQATGAALAGRIQASIGQDYTSTALGTLIAMQENK